MYLKRCEQMVGKKQCKGEMIFYTEHGRTVWCCPVCRFDEGEEVREEFEKKRRDFVETKIAEAMIDNDFVVRMPPKEKGRVKVKIKSIKKGIPREDR